MKLSLPTTTRISIDPRLNVPKKCRQPLLYAFCAHTRVPIRTPSRSRLGEEDGLGSRQGSSQGGELVRCWNGLPAAGLVECSHLKHLEHLESRLAKIVRNCVF